MDLRKLLEEQKKLDELILKNAGLTEYPRQKILLALLTELGELANEIKSFKYWKKNVKTDRERIIDEFADCLHFGLSLENDYKELYENELELTEEQIKEYKRENIMDIDTTFIEVFKSISNDEYALGAVLSIGVIIGLTEKEMEEGYIRKNRINYHRQENGY